MSSEKNTFTANQMATLAVNVLRTHFLEASRTAGKRIFRSLLENPGTPLTNLQMEDGGWIGLELSLDTTAFQGNLNYSAFRDSLRALLTDTVMKLQDGQDIKTFHPILEEGEEIDPSTPSKLFAAGAWSPHEGHQNLLMMGMTPDPAQPILRLQLLYIDQQQFHIDAISSAS